jgi:hypothetical protein
MATLFLDYEGGNDNYGGTSFALKASGTDGTIVTATFTSATASFPNDGSLIGQYLSIFNGTIYAVYNITAWVSATSLTIAAISGGTALANQAARQYYIGGRWQNFATGPLTARINAGDTIRIMGSPAPTSLGINGTWTSAQLSGTTAITAATNASPIVITSASHGLVTGDTVVVTAVGGNTAANGTWEVTVSSSTQFSLNGSTGNGAYISGGTVRKRTNTRVQLASALTQTIASTGPRSAWTASASVTATLNTTDYKEHQYSDSIDIAAAFTTGKAATTTTGTLDLSGYQQVSFWIKQTAGTIGAAGAVSVVLCSDVNGNTPVNTINIPNITVLNNWTQVTVNTGAALGSSIRSIAFYVNTDNAAQTFLINNIIACKATSAADSLTLASLLGKNRSDDTWYGIQSINGTRVMLDNITSTLPTTSTLRGYSHSSGTETVTTYKREAIKVSALNNSTNFTTDNGTPSSPITYSGGWDRTSMSTQNIETWFDGQNCTGNMLYNTGGSAGLYIALDTLYAVRFNRSFVDFATGNNYTNIGASNSGSFFVQQNSTGESIINGAKVQGCTSMIENGGRGTILTISNFDSYGCATTAFSATGSTSCFFYAKNGRLRNSPYAISFYSTVGNLESVTTTDNDTSVGWDTSINMYCKKCIFNETTEFVYFTSYSAITYSQDHDNTPGNHKIFKAGGLIVADTATRHTASGFSWKFSPTSTISCNSRFPLALSLAKVACAANSLVTIKAWMYRDNVGLTMQLVCKGGQLAGVPDDVTSSVSTTGAWQEQTITFTPTEQGVVEILAYAYGGSTFNGWVDDMTISQA